MNIEIEDIARLNVAPGEVLLVRIPGRPSPQQLQHMQQVFAEALPGVQVMFASAGVSVEVVAVADADDGLRFRAGEGGL